MHFLSPSDLALFTIGVVIATIGFAAIVARAFPWKSQSRVLLWFGLLAAPYGVTLIFRTSAFRLTFAQPQRYWLFGERLADLSIIVPALLLFQEFYGKGWRSSVRWVILVYGVFAIVVFSIIVLQHRPDFLPGAGTGIVLLVPIVLLLGRVTGYPPPPLPHRRVLFAGLIIFFFTFSRDHLLNARIGVQQPGLEPYGFLILVFCLGYVAARRAVANERQLLSFAEEMRAATRIQASILPSSTPAMDKLRIAARYSPMTAVAGDFYDFISVQPGGLGILVADVAGHGVPAALVASMVKVAVSTQAEHAADPGKVITGLNSTLCREARGQYTTAVYLYLDESSQIGRYAAGGHPPPLLWRRTARTLYRLNESGLLLGVKPNEVYAQTEFALQRGDRILVYTDGILEASNADDQSFGDVKLTDFFEVHQDLGTEQFADELMSEVRAWPQNGGRQSQADDLTLVVIDVG